jgi:hypothetical protein
MQLVGAALLVVIVAYLAWRDGLLATATSASPTPSSPADAAPTAFPSGVTMLQPAGGPDAPAAIPAFKALPQPLLSISFCTS